VSSTTIDPSWFTVTTAGDAQSLQNQVYTLSFNPGTSKLSSFDFWPVGVPGSNAGTQIKVVDMTFDSKNLWRFQT